MTKATRRPWAVVLALAMLAAACSGDGSDAQPERPALAGEEPRGPAFEVTTVYAPELRVDLATMTRLPSGLHMKDVEVGEGEIAVTGRAVRVHYTGWLANGAMFDTSREGGSPMLFTLAAGNVIAGWEEGVSGMRPGGRRMLVIPPGLAYGERGYPGVIPPNSTLVFDVELVEVVER